MRTSEVLAGGGVPARWREAQTAEAEYWEGLSIGELLRISAEKPAFWDLVDAQCLLVGKDVLEIGTGPLGLSLASYHPAKVGVRRLVKTDPLPPGRLPTGGWGSRLVEWLRELAAEGEYVQAPAEELAYDREFDTVLCYNVLDHVADPPTVLRKAHAALRGGGHLVVGVDCYSLVGRLRFELLVRNVWPDSILVRAHPHSFLPGTVVKLVRQAGFDAPAVSGVPGWASRLAGSHCRPAFVARKRVESV
jgi:SAM-dependent methyltransferase